MNARLVATLAAFALGAAPAMAQSRPDVEVAVIAPFSGPYAAQGTQMLWGARLAVDDINAAGGIKALGGAHMKLLEIDTQDTVEKSKSAAQRLVAEHPNVIGGSGAWLSSFTLAVTEVTERAKMPWLTVSYADNITDRGFHYVFQTSMTADTMAATVMPMLNDLAVKATGKKLSRIAIVTNNTAANVSFFKPIREHILKDLGMTAVADEVYSPPLSDATALVQPLRAARPDLLLLFSGSVPEDKLMLDGLDSFGMGKGKLPLVGYGAHFATSELLKAVGKDELQGAMVIMGNWGAKGEEDVITRFEKTTGEKWMNQDSIATYGDMMILKYAVEKAGSIDHEKVTDAIRNMDISDGPALFYPGHHIKFDDKGRRIGAEMVLVQWQNGIPQAIFPPDVATVAPIWTGH